VGLSKNSSDPRLIGGASKSMTALSLVISRYVMGREYTMVCDGGWLKRTPGNGGKGCVPPTLKFSSQKLTRAAHTAAHLYS
jgi:hypothetical protein